MVMTSMKLLIWMRRKTMTTQKLKAMMIISFFPIILLILVGELIWQTNTNWFFLLITDDIIGETNLSANQFLENNGELPRYSHVHVWKKKAFWHYLYMGLIRYPKLEDYWSTLWPFHIHFSDVMSRDHFSVILKFFHLNDSSKFIPKGSPGYDPLYKLQTLLQPLLRNFRSNFTF